MDASGGVRSPSRSSLPVRALNPIFNRVTVPMRTRPRSMRSAQVTASGEIPTQTRADLSISQPGTPTPGA